MTSVYDAKGRLCPVTVIAAGDNVLLRRLTEQNDGYSAVQVGFAVQKESRVTKPLLGEFKKAGVGPQKFVREFRLTNDLPEGEINLSVTQFQAGDYVDVIGRSKGKGFQGVMKKHNFHGQGAAHGSKTHRRVGAVALPVGGTARHGGFRKLCRGAGASPRPSPPAAARSADHHLRRGVEPSDLGRTAPGIFRGRGTRGPADLHAQFGVSNDPVTGRQLRYRDDGDRQRRCLSGRPGRRPLRARPHAGIPPPVRSR